MSTKEIFLCFCFWALGCGNPHESLFLSIIRKIKAKQKNRWFVTSVGSLLFFFFFGVVCKHNEQKNIQYHIYT